MPEQRDKGFGAQGAAGDPKPQMVNQVIERHDVGPHRMEIEKPDVVHIHYQGNVTLEQFKIFDALIDSLPPGQRVYLLRDGRSGGVALPDARAYMLRAAHLPRLIAVVTYGAAFQARTLVTMANTAVRTLKQQKPDLAFFNTEAEARAWIAKHRQQMGEAMGPSSRT